jgi:uncharacterized protein
MDTTRIKLSSRPWWRRVKESRFSVWKLNGTLFSGYVTRLDLLEVTSPLWVKSCGEEICVADEGYSWLQHFPRGTHYTLTSQWDEKGEILQWYFDICEKHGLTDDGIPYWEDLYLDIVGTPDHTFELLDQDELVEALEQKRISSEQYKLAVREADKLLRLLKDGSVELLELAKLHYAKLAIDSARVNSNS